MTARFPAAVPEIPVASLAAAAAYYTGRLGFTLDWGGEGDGNICGLSRDDCRLFLTDAAFRQGRGNQSPIVIWINLNSTAEVDALHAAWAAAGARIVAPPQSQPWLLHEFTAADLDGNQLRVFYDFRHDI